MLMTKNQKMFTPYQQLSIDYEKSIKKEKKKSQGSYYTPYEIVEYMCDNSIKYHLKNGWNLDNIKITDPAMGTWNFLVWMAYTLLKRRWFSKKNKEELRKIYENNLYWVDLDWDAIEVFKEIVRRDVWDIDFSNYIIEDSLLMDWKLHFWEIFKNQWGFDIVIGNPPYINIYDINKNLKKQYSKYKTAYQKYDLYVLFYEKWIDLLRQRWNICFITSNKFLSQWYWLKLRHLFLNNKINTIINFNYDIFDNATVRTLIFLLEKNYIDNNLIKIIDINSFKDSNKFIKLKYTIIKQSIFNDTDENNFRINLTKEKIQIIEKIKNDSIKLENICSVNYWLRPSSKDWKLWKNDFIYDYSNNWNYVKYAEWKDLWYWKIKNNMYLNYSPNIMYNPMFIELFENNKLVWLRTLSDIWKLRFNYDDKWVFFNDSVVLLTLWYLLEWVNNITINRTINDEKITTSKNFSYKYLQGILNSKIIKFFVNELLYDWTHFYPNHMKQLPIKQIYSQEQKPFIQKVNKILTITSKENYNPKNPPQEQIDLENEIDVMVYKLYELTYDEVLIVDPEFWLSKDEYEEFEF